MKKALFIIAALASCMTVSAKYWFGGSIGFDTESYYYNDNKYHLFEFSPIVGMAIEDNLDLGIQFTVQDLKYSDGQKEFTFNFAPFLRYTFFNEGNFSMFLDGGFQYGICSPSGYNWWHVGVFASPGIKYAMSDHFRLEALFRGLYFDHENNPDSQPRYFTYKNNAGFGLVWITRILSDKEYVLHFSREIFHFDIKIARRSLSIGMAPFLMNVASCFVVILINRQLQTHGGDMAIGAYGIINRIVFLFVMLILGFTQGMQPIAGYNYGAKQYDRVKLVLKMTIICATISTTIGFLIGELIPGTLVSLFTRDETLRAMAAHALRIDVALFPVVGFQIVVSNFFQCIGYVNKAIFLSLSRQLIFLIPFLIIFPGFWGTDGVWWSMPASDLIASVIAFLMISRLMKTFGQEERAILE